MNRDILTLSNVSRSFGGTEVLSRINIAFQNGQIHAPIGENDAGKSTAGKIAGGYYKRSSGAIMLDGHRVTRWDPPSAFEAGVIVLEVSDRISVLRDGELVSTAPACDHDKASLVGAMLGTASTEIHHADLPPLPSFINPLLSVKSLSAPPRT